MCYARQLRFTFKLCVKSYLRPKHLIYLGTHRRTFFVRLKIKNVQKCNKSIIKVLPEYVYKNKN